MISSPAMHDMLRMKGVVSVKQRLALIQKLRDDGKVMPVTQRVENDSFVEFNDDDDAQNTQTAKVESRQHCAALCHTLHVISLLPPVLCSQSTCCDPTAPRRLRQQDIAASVQPRPSLP